MTATTVTTARVTRSTAGVRSTPAVGRGVHCGDLADGEPGDERAMAQAQADRAAGSAQTVVS